MYFLINAVAVLRCERKEDVLVLVLRHPHDVVGTSPRADRNIKKARHRPSSAELTR